MTREEHVAWAKKRALEYLDRGAVTDALVSMASDMRKHPDCGVHPAVEVLGMQIAIAGDAARARHWIEGFN